MAGPDAIFDSALLRRRLRRAAATPADFLLVRTAQDIRERLDDVRRDFTAIADVGTPGPMLAAALAARWPAARLIRLAPNAPFIQDARAPAAATASGDPALPSHGGGCVAVGDPEHLPLADQSLDLAVSALALQTANDLPGALVQIRRALRPDGLFLGALIGGRTLSELRTVLTEAESAMSGGVSPRVAPFADVRDMGGLLQRAGFALPVADSDIVTVRYDNLFKLMGDLRAMGATNALVARSRKPARRELFLRAAALYGARFADPDGRIRATFEIVSISGWAPHESQQKPAKRGSGQVSLAAVLRNPGPPSSES